MKNKLDRQIIFTFIAAMQPIKHIFWNNIFCSLLEVHILNSQMSVTVDL